MYKWIYKTPIEFDDIVLCSDGDFLTGLYFDKSKGLDKNDVSAEEKYIKIFEDTIKWLDIYFSGRNPDFVPKYKINNLTSFRKDVIDLMNKIPYGETVTYDEIAKSIARKRTIYKMSAQAVGGAASVNPICIIVPCHRVVGKNGKLTGYGGGIKNKQALLKLEGIYIDS